MKREEEIKQRYERVAAELNERTRRLLAASEALAIGWGGVSMVSSSDRALPAGHQPGDQRTAARGPRWARDESGEKEADARVT